MHIDTTDALKKTAIIASAIGITVAAPYLGFYIIPFLTPFLKDVAKAGIAGIGGVASNALWDLKDCFEPSHENEDMTRLLGNAYSLAIEDVLKQAETDQTLEKLTKYILPSIKSEIDRHLATGNKIDLVKLFPTEENLLEIECDDKRKTPFYKRIFSRNPVEYQSVDENLLTNTTSEEFILKISDDGKEARKLVGEEVEISLRRWFVQLNPLLAKEYTFPPSLDKFVFEEIGELIPQKINELIKNKDLNRSWLAFQRSHLQAILKQVNNLNNGLSEDDRKLLRPLGEALEKLSENNQLVKKLADGTATILGRVGESEENVKNCIAEERRKLQDWLADNFDELKNSLKDLHEKVDRLNPASAQRAPLKSQFPPNIFDRVYGRKAELETILDFLQTSKKHPVIVGFTCLGKTSLMRKFLYKHYDFQQNVSKLPEVFTGILYIDCRQTRTFEEILRRFEAFIQTVFLFDDGSKAEFLKDKVFSQIAADKILLIFDNFEEWQADGEYANDDIKVFLDTFFANSFKMKAIFLSWFLPHKEIEFNTKVESLTTITVQLEQGLTLAAAQELVKEESHQYCGKDSIVDLDGIKETDLKAFFKDVSYIPQSIQSMVHFIGRKQCTFKQFLTKYRQAFDAEQSDETELDQKRDKILRPAKALIKLQLSTLNPKAIELLYHIAFYQIDVPQDILILDLANVANESEANRDELNRLHNDRLVIQTVNRNDHEPFIIYNLHEFVRQTVSPEILAFTENHSAHLENLADQMDNNIRNSWENKLFYKQLALSECREHLENYLIEILKRTERQYQRDLVDFSKALASQQIAETFAVNLTDEQSNELSAKSEELYRGYIRKYPNDAKAHNNLGILLAKDERRFTEAEQFYNEAIRINPNYAEAHYNLGILLAKDERRFVEAEQSYNEAIRINPDYANAHYNLGILFAKDKRRFAEAEQAYNKAIRINPNDADAHNNLGVLLAKDERRFAEAEQSYNEAIRINPDYADAHYNLGNLLSEDERRFAEAEQSYNEAIRINPDYADAHYNLGILLATKAERFDDAEQAYNEAIRINPNDADAHYNLGILLAKDERRFVEAEQSYNEAIRINPDYANAHYNLGNLLAKDKRRFDEAERSYNEAIRINSNDAKAHNNLGVLLAKDERRFAEAERAYNEAIRINPDYANAHNNLGNLLATKAERFDDAEQAYNEAIRINPNYAKAYGNLALLKVEFIGEEAIDEIIECLSNCVKFNPALKEWVKGFSGTEWIRDDPRFKEIVGDG